MHAECWLLNRDYTMGRPAAVNSAQHAQVVSPSLQGFWSVTRTAVPTTGETTTGSKKPRRHKHRYMLYSYWVKEKLANGGSEILTQGRQIVRLGNHITVADVSGGAT